MLVMISLVLLGISSCTNLFEEEYDEHIKRPSIDVPIPPAVWDTIPQNDNDIEFETTKNRKNEKN